jgi:hypothetical protein
MSVRPNDLLVYAGGECFQKFGVPVWRRGRDQGLYTYTGSGGGFVDKNGVLRQASAGRLRVEYADGVPGLLLDAGATNLVTDDDISAWDTTTSPASVLDNGDGTYAVVDDSTVSTGAGIEKRMRTIPFTGDGQKAIVAVLRENSPPASGGQAVTLLDDTASTLRMGANILSWVAGEPQVTMVGGPGGGFGTHYGNQYLGDGLWAIYLSADGVVAANTNILEIQPAGVADQTGSIDVYRINAYDRAVPPIGSILDASGTLDGDLLYLPFPYPPTAFADQGGTLYGKWIERGTRELAIAEAQSKRYLALGETSGTAARALLFASSLGVLRVYHGNGVIASDQTAGGATPAIGDVVEMICQIYPDGSVQGHVSINGAAVVSGSQGGTPIPFASEWQTPNIALNSTVSGGALGLASFQKIIVARRVHTIDECAAVFAYGAA